MKKTLAILLALALAAAGFAALAEGEATPGKAEIEAALNLANNPDQEWTYSADADAWTLSVVTAVTKPVIESEEGVSVCVPGAYVTGIDATAEWQWDGGHVPSEIFGSSLALRVDSMYSRLVLDGQEIGVPDDALQTANGTAEAPTGTDLSGWVNLDEDGSVSFALGDIAAYRTAAASKATPGFDVIDYGQEDYVFGDSDTDARHWSEWVLKALEENRDTLEPLFNQ